MRAWAAAAIDAQAARLREPGIEHPLALGALLEGLVRALLVAWLENEQMAGVEAVMNPAFEVPTGDYDLSLEADREYIAGRLAGRRAVVALKGVDRLEAALATCGLSGDVPAEVRAAVDGLRRAPDAVVGGAAAVAAYMAVVRARA